MRVEVREYILSVEGVTVFLQGELVFLQTNDSANLQVLSVCC